MAITGKEDCVEAEALLSQEEAWGVERLRSLGNNLVEEISSLTNLYTLEKRLLFNAP
ncbi:MAG: hypothetical protein AAGF01_29965 [Cyanobacteria bacterium P01_G01_bin.38]